MVYKMFFLGRNFCPVLFVHQNLKTFKKPLKNLCKKLVFSSPGHERVVPEHENPFPSSVYALSKNIILQAEIEIGQFPLTRRHSVSITFSYYRAMHVYDN